MFNAKHIKTWLVIVVFLLDSSGFWHLAMAKVLQPAKKKQQQKVAESLSPEVSTNWWAKVQENIKRSEYNVTWQEKTNLPDLKTAYQAPNRAQNLRTYFTPTGIRVIQRTQSESSWQWGMSLIGYGYAGDVKPVAKARLVANNNRIEYQRDNLIEWYVNDENGIEQGFIINAPPKRNNSKAKTQIVLAMKIGGSLSGRLEDKGSRLIFADDKGQEVINYGSLHVEDAAGKKLAGRFILEKQTLSLMIDTTGARYPVSIDPVITGLSTTADWTAEGNQIDAYFGLSVSTAGDVNGDGYYDVIVGAPNYDNGQSNEGAAFVYYGSVSGLSTSPDWTAESNQANASYGWSVSTAGDVNGDGCADVIVGAPDYTNSYANEGRALVYRGSVSGLSTSPSWTLDGSQVNAQMGWSVSTAGDVNGDGYADVIVGAYYYTNGQTGEGMAFVFHGSASGLSSSDWAVDSDQANAYFGWSVSTAGDVNGDGYADVIVGAERYDNGQTDEGRAFVYHGSASGLSTSPNWTAESDQANAYFGGSVSTAGDVNGDGYADVVVGARSYDNPEIAEGLAFVYHGSGSGLSGSANWVVESNQAGATFGYSVSTAGDVNGDGYADIIVGARGYDNPESAEGAVFVYHGSATGLSTTADWTADSDQVSALFGCSVSTAGDVNGDGYADVIVGAEHYDNGQSNEGAAFAYYGSAAGLSTTVDWAAESNQASASFGYSVSTAGDINGDGCADVIVGAYHYDNGQTDEGRAFVYHGSATGLSVTADWMAESDQASAYFGYSVSTAGDINGDGYADVIVGADDYDNGQTNEGAAFVWYGSASGLGVDGTPLNADWTAESNQIGAFLGCSVSTAGDVNGDGYADVIVGASWYDNGQTAEGAAFVWYGSAAGLGANGTPANADWMAESNQVEANFGDSVSTAGDVNGDGCADVIVGAWDYDNGQSVEGAAFVWHGSAAGLGASGNPGNADWTAEGNQANARFGHSVSTAGDVNGDGYADIIVGVPYYDYGQTDEGAAFVYLGSAVGLSTNADWMGEGNQAGARFGFSVSTAGDVNGDGYADVIVGAPDYDKGQTTEGVAFAWYGSAADLGTNGNPGNADWTAEVDQAGARFGFSVSTAGDVNGDGYADIIVGADSFDNGQSDEGAAFVYCGNAGAGLSLKPRQRRADDIAPIAHMGISDSNDSFRLALLGRTPFGRGKVKLQWEVKPLGTLFNSAGLVQSASWTDTGTAGAELSELVSGLSDFAVYHWRVRLLYHPATTPFQQYSRWLTRPWNGWQEADMRTPCRLKADLTGDCLVNFLDFAIMAAEWLL